MKKIFIMDCRVFIISYFDLYDEFYILDYYWLIKQKNIISYEKIKLECRKIGIIFPGILDLNFLEI
jgi:penicillin-binding protein-related factor A (putative recombinase)